MTSEQTQLDHKAYQRHVRRLSAAELAYAARDAREAREAMPDGHKAGFYADEEHYCLMELARRRREGIPL